MKKLATIGTALALAFTLSACGKKKEEEKKPEAAKPAEPAPAPAPAPAPTPTPAPADPAAPAPADPAAPAAAASTGVPECDEYLATFEKFSKCDKAGPALEGLKTAAEAQKTAFSSWASMDDASKKAAQAAAAPGCKGGTDAIKAAAQATGCTL